MKTGENVVIRRFARFIVGAESRDQSGTELRLGISSSSNSPPMLDLNLQNATDGAGEVTRFSNGSTTGGDLSAAPGFSFVAGTPDRWYCVEAMLKSVSTSSSPVT